MRVLVIGNGGREHALAWRLKQSPSVSRVICPNGSPGMALEAETPRVELKSPEDWADYAAESRCDLVVVGPEAPLAAGVADACLKKGIKTFGPTKEGAQIESSKSFAKDVMQAAEIPTGQSGTFEDYDKAMDFAKSLGLPVVIKADGLAAGKGVAICETQQELVTALTENLKEARFGESSRRVLVEEFLDGEEASILALTDGEEVYPLVPSQDHKRAYDGDAGPNTGGMGAYAPAPIVTNEVMSAALSMVLRPAVRELANRGIKYTGCLYAGLILTKDGPKVLEFNCRFGDPEAQVVLPLFEGDLGEVMFACCEGHLSQIVSPPVPPPDPKYTVGIKPLHAVCVVLASGGYPLNYETGKVIHGLETVRRADCKVFHAGTREGEHGEVLTNGGRVLGLTAWSESLTTSLSLAYQIAEQVTFEGGFYRRDIAHRALRKT